MTKRVLRGYSAETLTRSQIADEIKLRCKGVLWISEDWMIRALGDRAGVPRKTKVTIIVEFPNG